MIDGVPRTEVSLRRRFSICSTEEMKIASKKAVPNNFYYSGYLGVQSFFDWVHHSKEVESRSYTAQDLWRHARSEDEKCLNILNASLSFTLSLTICPVNSTNKELVPQKFGLV